MGERGIERPVWSPEGTSFTFHWPQGVARGERDRLIRVARRAVSGDPAAAVRWLQRNAWKHLGPKRWSNEWIVEEPKSELDDSGPGQEGEEGGDEATE